MSSQKEIVTLQQKYENQQNRRYYYGKTNQRNADTIRQSENEIKTH